MDNRGSRQQLREVLLSAASALHRDLGVVATGKERGWGSALAEQLRADPRVDQVAAEGPHTHLEWDWSRRPGRIDLTWTAGLCMGAAELKLRKPDELTWDLVKLADQTGTDRPFTYGSVLVQVEPSDLAKGSGALLSGALTGLQRPIEWIGRWPGDWRWLMQGGRGIRPLSLPRSVRLSAPVTIGDPATTHWIVLAVESDSHLRDALDPWGWPVELGERPDGWEKRITPLSAQF